MSADPMTTLKGDEALLYAERFGYEVVVGGVVRTSSGSARTLLENMTPEMRADVLPTVTVSGRRADGILSGGASWTAPVPASTT